MKKLARARAEFPKVLATILLAIGLLFYWRLTPNAIQLTPAASKYLRLSIGADPKLSEAGNAPNTAQVAVQALEQTEVEERCWGTKGTWCKDWLQQKSFPWTPPPRGNKTCLWDCNRVGVCDAMAGWCRCPAGWTGDACDQRMRRPCSQKHRSGGFLPYDEPIDWNEVGLTLRCAGECDDDIGMCFCSSDSKYGRKPADITLPPNTPPVQVGRPLGHHCQPNKIPGTDRPTKFGEVNNTLLFGDKGWCQADEPEYKCPCYLDGMLGPNCDIPAEHFCVNQCSGHGECILGWCRCHQGYFGQDCAYRLPGIKWDSGLLADRPWLEDFIRTPASEDPPPGSTRKRPLIYVYELEPMYNQLMLQYRFSRASCTHRLFEQGNVTEFRDDWMYQADTGIHEMLLQSRHRTLDPEEADFFYIPVYVSCFFWPVFGAADFPFFHSGPTPTTRASQGTNMMIEAWSWLRSHYQYWDRNNGKDHIITVSHDEGSCFVPAVLRNATLLVHWGRKDINHTSGTAYDADNYDLDVFHELWQPEGHRHKLGNFSCYDPGKDLVIPPMFSPIKYSDSPFLGAPAQPRDILAYFKGDLRLHDKRNVVNKYSRGIRQKLARLCDSADWWGTHRIWVGSIPPPSEPYNISSYSFALASSTFCFVLPGDGWSGRFEDSVMHGCIPVIIQDDVDVSFESIMNMSSFSIRINQSDIKNVPEILKAVPSEEVERLHAGVKKVWRRYWYGSYPPHRKAAENIQKNWRRLEEAQSEGYVKMEVEAQMRREEEINREINEDRKQERQQEEDMPGILQQQEKEELENAVAEKEALKQELEEAMLDKEQEQDMPEALEEVAQEHSMQEAQYEDGEALEEQALQEEGVPEAQQKEHMLTSHQEQQEKMKQDLLDAMEGREQEEDRNIQEEDLHQTDQGQEQEQEQGMQEAQVEQQQQLQQRRRRLLDEQGEADIDSADTSNKEEYLENGIKQDGQVDESAENGGATTAAGGKAAAAAAEAFKFTSEELFDDAFETIIAFLASKINQ